MERAFMNISIPNIISVGIIAGILYLGYIGFRKYIVKAA
jgi:hypothetical protein